MRNSSIVPLVLVASGVSALVPSDAFNALLPRQTTACTSICAPFISTTNMNNCTDLACLCTAATANALQLCVNCAVDADPTSASVITSANLLVYAFDNSCSGYSLPTVTVGAMSTTSTVATALNSLTFSVAGTSTISNPSSTTDDALPMSTTASSSSPGSTGTSGSSGSSGYTVLVPMGLVMNIGAALGLALVY